MHKGRNEETKLNGDAQQERKHISDVLKKIKSQIRRALNKELHYDAK